MNVESLILQRRTVHDYKAEAVDIELVKTALNLAIHAPNHKKTWPWKFVIAGDEAKAKIASLAVELKSNKEDLSEPKKNAIRQKFMNVSYLIALAQKKSSSDLQSKEDYASIACGVQNISLYLWQHGIGTKWSSGAVTSDKKTYEIFQLNELEYELQGFLWVGHPLRIPQVAERPELKTFYKIID